jgi:hypothetical protein
MARKVLPKIEVGHKQETSKHGWFCVVEVLEKNWYKICFDNTNHVQKSHLANIRSNKISDQSLHPKNFFITKAINLHGDKYDYSAVVYKNQYDNVYIRCKKHDLTFKQTPKNHLNGQGCPECAKITRSEKMTFSYEDFVTKSVRIHGDRYDYSKVNYSGNNKDVEIICKEHGSFLQKPCVHWMPCGCPKCASLLIGELTRKSTEQFIQEAKGVHGDKYDYTLVNYYKAVDKVEIICPEHGIFLQTPIGHITGRGCHKCARTGFNPVKRGNVYVLNNGDYFKIGITNKNPQQRCDQLNKTSLSAFHVEFSININGDYCRGVEKEMHDWLFDQGCTQPESWFPGWTECFRGVSLQDIINKLSQLGKEYGN